MDRQQISGTACTKYTARAFFVNYQKGKCTTQPKLIATYLELNDAEEYTGHSFRRTSATLLANESSDMLQLKRHGGWKSGTVAEGYFEDKKCKLIHINIVI